jgi:hypothetical protein
MKMFAALVLLALPLPAAAAPANGSATLSAAALPERVVVDGRQWRCADGHCTGPAELRRVAVERVCKDLARKIGAVSALSVGGMTLADEQLAACNRAAR